MTWAAPWAWALALAAILPIAAHLWSRRRPPTVPFLTLRFLRAASPVSRRLRRVQEWPLLLLRLAIVAAICAAAAGPTLVSPWREQAWRDRLHRIVVVDTAVATQAASVLQNDRQDVSASTVLGPAPVADLLDEALAQAARRARRMRTEIVIVWDGSRAALTPDDVVDVPAPVGLRLLPVESATRGAPAVRITGEALPITIQGDASDGSTRERMLAALRTLAIPRLVSPIEVRWPGAPNAAPGPAATTAPELRRVLDAIADDARVRDAAERSARDRRRPAHGVGTVVGRGLARAPDGKWLLRGWGEGDRLVLALDATPTSPLAWWSVVAAVEAIARPWNVAAAMDRWSPADVAGARREPTPPPASSLPRGLDTRGAWAAALVLLLLEQWWRRRRSTVSGVEVSDAA